MKLFPKNIQTESSIGLRVKARLLRAFSLIEMLVVTVLLAVIILGLVAMFDQVRKAFTSSVTQVDMLEGGRMAMDLITREIEEMTPHNNPFLYNFYVAFDDTAPLLVQPLTDPNDKKTNVLESFYFFSSYNHQVSGIGFTVNSPEIQQGIPIGALYTTNYFFPALVGSGITTTNGLKTFTDGFLNDRYTNFHRLVDGVVHLRVLAYDTRGHLLNTNWNNNLQNNTNFTISADIRASESYSYGFYSNVIPAYVDVELGVLEDRTLQKLRAITNGTPAGAVAANNFLNAHAAQVHLFRQRIPIRNVDPQAYK